MQRSVHAWYASAADLRRQLEEHEQQGALLLPFPSAPADWTQYASLVIELHVDDKSCTLEAELLQVMEGVGLVVRLADVSSAFPLVAGAPSAEHGGAPRVELQTPAPVHDDSSAAGADGGPQAVVGPPVPLGSSPLSWPIEKLQLEFGELSMADKVRLARYGRREARAMILRGQDRTLQTHLLHNSRITPEEVAVLAGSAAADAALLKRLLASPEWLRHLAVARALICNPKLTVPQAAKLLRYLPTDEMRRLARTGKVRAAIKRELLRKIEGGR